MPAPATDPADGWECGRRTPGAPRGREMSGVVGATGAQAAEPNSAAVALAGPAGPWAWSGSASNTSDRNRTGSRAGVSRPPMAAGPAASGGAHGNRVRGATATTCHTRLVAPGANAGVDGQIVTV